MSFLNQAIGNGCLAISQERIGGLLHGDRRRNRGPALGALCLFLLHALLEGLVRGFDFESETKVCNGVLVRAVNLRLIRKQCKFAKRRRHLFRGALEQTAAAAGEQRVSAEQPTWLRRVVGDVTKRMSGHFEHPKRQAQLRHIHDIVFAQRHGYGGDAVIRGTKHRDLELAQERLHTAHMVSMVMCQ